jgi:hypothetical protein
MLVIRIFRIGHHPTGLLTNGVMLRSSISLSASEEPVGHSSGNRPSTQATKVPALEKENSIPVMGLD